VSRTDASLARSLRIIANKLGDEEQKVSLYDAADRIDPAGVERRKREEFLASQTPPDNVEWGIYVERNTNPRKWKDPEDLVREPVWEPEPIAWLWPAQTAEERNAEMAAAREKDAEGNVWRNRRFVKRTVGPWTETLA